MISQSELPTFDAAWRATRQREHCALLELTLGPYFAQKWITERGDDPLVTFLIDDEHICMEFARSSYIEFLCADCPVWDFACRNPRHAWEDTLAASSGNEMHAIASILWTAYERSSADDGFHMRSGEAVFLGALGLDRACE